MRVKLRPSGACRCDGFVTLARERDVSRRNARDDATERCRRVWGRNATVSSPFPGDGTCPRRPRLGRALPYALAVDGLLLAWFRENGRSLPWRETTDPYAILVSEVMLQQTQVERVIPRWRRWLERWPTVDALAARVGRRGDRRVAGPRLQPARPEPASRRGARRRARLARGPHRASRRRPVHRGRGRQLRLRPRRAARRHERAPRTGADRLRVRLLRAHRRCSTSARPCASRASRAAGPAHSRRAAPRAARATSRCASRARSKARSGSAEPRLSAPWRRVHSRATTTRSRRWRATAWSCYATERRPCPYSRSAATATARTARASRVGGEAVDAEVDRSDHRRASFTVHGTTRRPTACADSTSSRVTRSTAAR